MAAARQRAVIRVVRVLRVAKLLSVASVRRAHRVPHVMIKAKAPQLPSARVMSITSVRPSRVRNAQALSWPIVQRVSLLVRRLNVAASRAVKVSAQASAAVQSRSNSRERI